MPSEDTLVFRADNVHADDCGEPPRIVNGQSDLYYGYFENELGEQWVLVIDRDTKRGTLRGGDAGWHAEHEVVDGEVVDVVLNPLEHSWLRACWQAATGKA